MVLCRHLCVIYRSILCWEWQREAWSAGVWTRQTTQHSYGSFWPFFPTWTPLSHLSGTPGLTAGMASGWCTLDGICSQVSEFREVGAVSVVHLTMLGSVRAWSHQWILKVYSVESFCSYN